MKKTTITLAALTASLLVGACASNMLWKRESAISISALMQSSSLLPFRSATPYSVTTRSRR